MVTDVSLNIAISTFTGKQPTQQPKRFCYCEKQRVNVEQPNIINQYNTSTGGVDRMDQNTLAYMINLHPKEWWWPLFRFVADVAVNNAYQMYRQSHLHHAEYRLDALGFRWTIVDAYYHLYRKSLPSTTLFTGSRSLHHPANNLHLAVPITGLPRAHSDDVAYQDVKEPCYIIAKNLMSVTVRRAVCKVYLR